jgi:Protein of unknown function (DUF2806)
MSEGSLINLNLGALAAPVEKLIDRVSDAVGGIARPWQIERVARAEGKASVARAEAQITVSEIEQRAIQRLVREEGKRQENIESITYMATSNVSESARPEDIEEDWLTNFFDRCRSVSDDEMQKIWANILSGEANNPGRFDRKTVDLLSAFGKTDAEEFKKMMRFTVFVPDPTLIIFNYKDEIYKKNRFDFDYFQYIQELGLVDFNFLSNYNLSITGDDFRIKYCDKNYRIDFSDKKEFSIGNVILTRAGSQLVRLCTPVFDEEFSQYFCEKIAQQKLIISHI